MKFGSVCSGIEAASVAWKPLGWTAAWLAEIEPFPSAVLAHHYPDVPNLGDMTKLPERIRSGEIEAPDIFCGGTPCQAFSVAGLRKSLDDARGNLSLTFCEIANEIDSARHVRGEPPAIVFWENVPGVLNTKDNAFGCFLAGLAGEDDPLIAPGGKWTNAGCVLGPKRAVAWRVLDAQYFGVAQRRRRVFVVASARNGFDPAAVLFEFDGLRRDTAPSREARQGIAGSVTASSGRRGGVNEPDSGHLRPIITMAHGQGGAEIAQDRSPCLTCNHEAPIAAIPDTTHTLRGEGFDASEDGTGRGTPLVPMVAYDHACVCGNSFFGAIDALCPKCGGGNSITHGDPREVLAFDTTQVTSAANRSSPKPGDPCHPLAAGAHAPAIAFPANLSGTQHASTEDLCPALGAVNPTAIAFSCKDHGADASNDIAPTMRAMGHTGSHPNAGGQLAVAIQDVRGTDKAQNGCGWNDSGTAYTLDTHATQGVLAYGFQPRIARNGRGDMGELVSALNAQSGETGKGDAAPCVAYTTMLHNTGSNNAGKIFEERTTCLDANSPPPALLTAMQVRRLTPVECERLQGFPDGYTDIPWTEYQRVQKLAAKSGTSFEAELKKRGKVLRTTAKECPDGPRYKALGNSWAVPNVAWIGRRIQRALQAAPCY